MASTRSNISIVQPQDGMAHWSDIMSVPTGTTDTTAPGDLINMASATCEVYDTVNDADSYLGVCNTVHRNGDSIPLTVYTRALIKVTLASAGALVPGDGLIYSAGDNGTDWTFTTDSSGTNIIAWAFEVNASTSTTLNALTDSFQVAAGRVSGDGLWEAAAT